jgi:hypothetical protein
MKFSETGAAGKKQALGKTELLGSTRHGYQIKESRI